MAQQVNSYRSETLLFFIFVEPLICKFKSMCNDWKWKNKHTAKCTHNETGKDWRWFLNCVIRQKL